jgi:hypothetical protein
MLDAASDPAVPYPRLLQDASLLPVCDAIKSGAARILRALLRSAADARRTATDLGEGLDSFERERTTGLVA